MFYLIGLTAITLIIFLISYLSDSRKLINGLLLNAFLFSFTVTICYIAFFTRNYILTVLFAVLICFVLIFGIYVLIISLFINAKVVIKRESRSISNLLTLFLAIALIFYLIWSAINPIRFLPEDVQIFLGSFYLIVIYYLFGFFNFLTVSLLYQFNKPKLEQDFIIVLGSRLFGDKVPPLLASRIDKAIEFYKKQSEVSNPPKIIFSGGQGCDEEIPEALGMQRYAIEKGVHIEDTILEDKSVNTLQNMKFSKSIMDKLMHNNHKSVFVTNNYHLFRAAIYSKMAGLESQGIGSKTASYFLPNAIIREYIAIVVMNKKRHVIVVSAILMICFLLALVEHFYVMPYM